MRSRLSCIRSVVRTSVRTSRPHVVLSLFGILLACFAFSIAQAGDDTNKKQAPVNAEEVAAIRKLLAATQPDMAIADIQPSPVAGLYEVLLSAGHAIYVSSDAKFLIPGDLYQAQTDGLVNLGEKRRTQLRLAKIKAVDEKDMIVFEPADGRKAMLTVFTDVDCPYCRKLHGEVEELNKLGIAVRYLAYPRQGLTGETYTKMISTWCADDKLATMTSAKRDAQIAAAACDSPVEEQYALGQEVGVTGTPALVLEDGTILPGYVPAATLAGYVFEAQRVAQAKQ
jgi:thiol:disulfide interchange protein DsbC